MPWRGAEFSGEFPTLGYLVAEFIETHCAIPDGDLNGRPLTLTDEMVRFLLWFYRLDPDTESPKTGGARFFYERGGQLVRPQKWGKGPFSAAIICAEAMGPVVPAGWDAKGDPVGRPWATPRIQVTAVSEGQTDNVWRALVPMVTMGSIGADLPDTGETRINLPGGGRIEPVTSSARSRLGQPIQFAVQDETHSWWQRNGGRLLADNQRRNLAGMGGRWLETTNAWDPTQDSVAQSTPLEPGVYVDYPQPPAGSVRNKRDRRKVMKVVYGDSARTPEDGRWIPWIDLDRIDLDIEALLVRDPAQAERFFLNRVHAGESVAFDVEAWARRADPIRVIPERSLIVIGVDGARYQDAVAMVATDVESGHQWVLDIQERPQWADDDYEHDFERLDGAMIGAFERYEVWRAYIDPQYIEPLRDRWQGRWGDKVVMDWFTNRPRPIAYAVRNYRTAVSAAIVREPTRGLSDLTHDGDAVFARHIGAARRSALNVKDDEGRPMWTLSKESHDSQNKIDAAMAGTLSWEARSDAIAAGAIATKKRSKVAMSF